MAAITDFNLGEAFPLTLRRVSFPKGEILFRVGRNRTAKTLTQPYGVSIHASCRLNLKRFHSSYQKEPQNNRISIIQMTFTPRKLKG